jgi:hypothetical protein
MVVLDGAEEFFSAGFATPAVVGEDAAILGTDAAATGAEGAVATEEGTGLAEQGTTLIERPGAGIDRGDGRDIFGKFTGSGGYGSDAEARGLAEYEEETGDVVIRDKARATLPDGSTRYYDG